MPDKVGVVPPPEGEVADFDYSRPWLYEQSKAVVIAGIVLCTVFLALRVYTKAHLLRKFGWDDVSLILAWVFGIVTQVLCLYGYAHGGIGIHFWNVTEEMFKTYQKGVFAAGIVYVPALACAKASLIILYYRIMKQQPVYRWALYVVSGIVSGYSIAIIFALIFACKPIAKGWDVSIEGHCVDRSGLYAATAVTNTITDVVLLVIPIPMVWSLHMPIIQKVGLALMFLIGCATVITSIIRLITLFPFLKSTDPTYQISWTDLWINVEANFIVICSCLPFLRQFLRRYAPRLIGEDSTIGRRYLKGYVESTTRSWGRRKPGLTQLQDEVELAENGESMHSTARIVKEVQWDVTEEAAPVLPGEGSQEVRREVVPGA